MNRVVRAALHLTIDVMAAAGLAAAVAGVYNADRRALPPAPADRPAAAQVSDSAGAAGVPSVPTPDDERRLGQAVHDEVVARLPVVSSGPLPSRLLEAARPVLSLRERKETDYRVYLLDTDELCSFCHIGGYIYVSRGLFYLIDDDAELQFLIAHEAAHLDRRDDLRQATLPVGPGGWSDPGLAALVCGRIAGGYPRECEFEADALAFRRLRLIGRSRREGLAFLRRYLGYTERAGAGGDRSSAPLGPPARSQGPEAHWRSLPSALDRLESLRRAPTPSPAG